MAGLIRGGEIAMRVLTHGEHAMRQSPEVLMQLQNFATALPQHLQPMGQQMVQTYNAYHGANTLAVARAVVNSVGLLGVGNNVYVINTLEGYQAAAPFMQQMLMANPYVRAQYHAGNINGWADTYVDHQPGVVGEMHDHYRMVMDGVVQTIEPTDENDATWKMSFYQQYMPEGTRELTMMERFDVLESWQVLEHIVRTREGEDPTSAFHDKF